MDDDFLVKFRKEPSPAFAKGLYQRIDKPMNSKPLNQTVLRSGWKLALAGAAALVTLALIVSPSARVMAQDFLDLFRVKHFAAISIDPSRISQLQDNKVDIQALISSSTEVLKYPGKPVTASSPDDASQKAGFTVRVPSALPAGVTVQGILVQGEGSVRFKAGTARLQTVVDALGLTDVQIPPQLNGQTVTVDKPVMVIVNYTGGYDHLTLMQSHNPQIALPQGVNLADLGEVALRVAGMSRDEAHRFAQSIDWTSTLIVPVPANASSFREVSVRNTTGLLITTSGAGLLPAAGKDPTGAPSPQTKAARPTQSGSILLWAEGDMVYAITGTANATLVDMANSLQ